MSSTEPSLDDIWRKIDLGTADDDLKIAAATLVGKNKFHSFVPRLLRLLEDDEGQVRYYALQSLVLDLQQNSGRIQELCWDLLRHDPDDDVRSLAATCIGKIWFNTGSRQIFRQLLAELKNPDQPALAKSLIYSALFKIAGRPPLEWPGLQTPRKVFEESDIDWEKVARLEDQLEKA